MSLVSLDQKQEQIVEAALKRFTHFGISKTTMNEIAEDLSLSKASLYYYFPDKTALVLSVGEVILTDFLKAQMEALAKADDFEEGILDILSIRISFGQKYFMMHIGDVQSDINTNDPKFKMMLEDLKSKELDFIAAHIQRFQDKGFLKQVDKLETAKVLIDMLIGIWVCGIHVHHKGLFPSEELFEDIKMKCERVITIFCDGIKRN